jgi:hypothetical protein
MQQTHDTWRFDEAHRNLSAPLWVNVLIAAATVSYLESFGYFSEGRIN